METQSFDKADFYGSRQPRLSKTPLTGAGGYSAVGPKAPSYKTCCTCSGLGMVEVNNGVGGYWTEYCQDCAAGIELEAQDAMAEALWDRQMAGDVAA